MRGKILVNKVRKNGTKYDFRKYPNLRVDDGTEYILDFFSGRATWHNYSNTRATYGTGMTNLWGKERWVALGTCMFNNASTERANGLDAVSGTTYYIQDYQLVSAEDSFLSRETGSRVQVTPERVDQTVEFYGEFNVPGDIASGARIREFGLFLSNTGPNHDPSVHDESKPKSMLCRSVVYGTGSVGGTGYYTDDPLVVNDTIQIRWKFGEI